jgi:hypothetical protein
MRRNILALCSLVIVVLVAGWFFIGDETRRAHLAPVHPDQTTVDVLSERQIESDEIALVFKNEAGKVVRVVADKDVTNSFVNSVLRYVQDRESSVNQKMQRDVDALFARAFATKNADLEAYADWHFAWLESWVILKEAIAGAIDEALSLSLSLDKVREASRHAVEGYFIRNFSERLLKPELRNPIIDQGIEQIIADAHTEMQLTIASLDHRVQQFIAENSNYTEVIDPAQAVDIKLDWDAAKWKAPVSNVDLYIQQGVQSVGTVAMSSVVLAGVIEATILPLLSGIIGSAAASTELAVIGAAAGSEFPGVGTLIGAGVGLLLDKAVNLFRESMSREDFIKDNRDAIDATVSEWKASIHPKLERVSRVWFDDISQAVAISQ